MGNFYTNITVLGADASAVIDQLGALGREAFVADRQDTEMLAALCENLSTHLAAKAFAVSNHDDDVLWFQLYDRSELVAEYANRGGPGTNVRALCRAFGRPGQALSTWLLLQRPFVFQISRHRRLARRLGLPEASVGIGFEYIDRGERPSRVDAARISRVRRGG